MCSLLSARSLTAVVLVYLTCLEIKSDKEKKNRKAVWDPNIASPVCTPWNAWDQWGQSKFSPYLVLQKQVVVLQDISLQMSKVQEKLFFHRKIIEVNIYTFSCKIINFGILFYQDWISIFMEEVNKSNQEGYNFKVSRQNLLGRTRKPKAWHLNIRK